MRLVEIRGEIDFCCLFVEFVMYSFKIEIIRRASVPTGDDVGED